MLLGPIFRVEIVTLARRRRYFLLRVVYGLLLLLVLWGAYSQTLLWQEETSIQAGQKLATAFFISFSWLQIFAILAVGPAMAVGTIASERERRTIEYLFATDLANHEIVLGKIIARLCLLGQFVLVGLPILFIFRMMGGISTDLLLGTFVLASSTAVMLTTLSVCVSVWSPRARDATTRVYSLLAVFLIFPGVISAVGAEYFTNAAAWQSIAEPILDFVHTLNPIYVLSTALATGIDLPRLVESVASQLFVSLFATLLAIAAVRRVHLGEATRGATRNRRSLPFQLPRWRRPLGNLPMVWKEVYSPSAKAPMGSVGRIAVALLLGVLFIGVVSTFILAIYEARATSSIHSSYNEALISITVMLGLCIIILLANKAAGSITSEKESDCWLALLATPLTGREILWGKICGCLYAMRWLLALLTLAWLLGIWLSPTMYVSAFATLATVLFAAWYTINLGLFFSLRSLTTMRAMGATLATLFFCGGGYLFCCCTVMMGGGGDDGWVIFLAPCIPFLLGFPIFGFDFTESGLRFTSEESTLYLAYLLGTFGYLIAGIAIYAMQVNRFDEFAGRCGTKPDGSKETVVHPS